MLIRETDFIKLAQNCVPLAIECLFIENPLTPKLKWDNKKDYKEGLKLDVASIYSTFINVAEQHWAQASQYYLADSLSDSIEYNTCKKFGYSIKFLDFAFQFATTGKISDFSLYDKIRTKIHSKELCSCFSPNLTFYQLV